MSLFSFEKWLKNIPKYTNKARRQLTSAKKTKEHVIAVKSKNDL